MHQVNIHEAKTQLSKLIQEAVDGEPFIIAKAGKPLVIVHRVEIKKKPNRLGFLRGEFKTPNDFDQMGADDIEHLFGESR